VIQNRVEDRLSDEMLSGKFEPGDIIVVDATGEELVLRREDAPALEEPDNSLAEAVA
jgi:ATP-dependent Clp protease ATP-binding subunit ClpA